MAGIPDFINLVNQLGAAAQGGQQSLSELQSSMAKLQTMQGQATGTAEVEAWAKAMEKVTGEIKKVTSEQDKQIKQVKEITREYGAAAGRQNTAAGTSA